MQGAISTPFLAHLAKMPKLLNVDPAARGIYQRNSVYWLRHTVDGYQERVPLHTRDFSEAVQKAKELRGKPTLGKPEKLTWQGAIRKYVADKVAGKRPAHLAGRRIRTFRPTTGPKVASALKVFAERTGVDSPAKVRVDHIQKYYDTRRKNSEAGARSTIAVIQAFLDHIQCLPKRIMFAVDRKPEARQVVVSVDTANKWIEACPTPQLKFILYCGFHAGLRRGEIVHSRPQWFDLNRRVLTIPQKEKQKLPGGRTIEWLPKDAEARQIPLSQAFCDFLKTFLESPRAFCLLGTKRSKDGLYDFRAPYESFMKAMGREDVTIHAMRHSWISELCNSGNHSITEIASWSGDTVETIEKNYWKKTTKTGGLDSTMQGKKAGHAQEEKLNKLMEKMDGVNDEHVQEQIRGAFATYFEMYPEELEEPKPRRKAPKG